MTLRLSPDVVTLWTNMQSTSPISADDHSGNSKRVHATTAKALPTQKSEPCARAYNIPCTDAFFTYRGSREKYQYRHRSPVVVSHNSTSDVM